MSGLFFRTGGLCLGAAIITGCATAPKAASVMPDLSAREQTLLGAWADGTSKEACTSKQITYFSADGVVLDLYSATGAFHSFGLWAINGDDLIITHNELPFKATGASDPLITLTLEKLDATALHIRNRKGELRKRTRCIGLELSDTQHKDRY